ncbi:MAG: trypsin-like peptidase domain-containing protein [Mycobacteriales bacterium]
MTPVGSASVVGASDETRPAARPRRARARWQWVLAVLLVGAFGALVVWRVNDKSSAPLRQADVDRAVEQGIERSQQQQREAPPDAATAHRTITPSLVTVRTDQSPAEPGPESDAADVGLGSGIVINDKGAVLTALHVVEGARQIDVEFADGTRSAARITKGDPATDIAVLEVDHAPQIVVPAVLAGAPQVGEPVFAVGNPLALERSLTAGVVSATGRRIRTRNGGTLSGLIQFDAAVNPGSSGGPLLNAGGQVVGIVTALANPSKQAYFIGIAFAVPIAVAGGAAGAPQQ